MWASKCPGPSFSGLAFSGLATWSFIFRSCIFRPCELVRHFQVLHFQVLHFQSPRTVQQITIWNIVDLSLLCSICVNIFFYFNRFAWWKTCLVLYNILLHIVCNKFTKLMHLITRRRSWERNHRQVNILQTSSFRKILKGHVRTVPGNMQVKFEVRIFNRFGASTVWFNAQKFRGSRDLGHTPFSKNFKPHVRTVPGNVHVKFEDRSFNRFKLAWLTVPLRKRQTDRQTDRTTSNEHIISAVRFVHLAEITRNAPTPETAPSLVPPYGNTICYI